MRLLDFIIKKDNPIYEECLRILEKRDGSISSNEATTHFDPENKTSYFHKEYSGDDGYKETFDRIAHKDGEEIITSSYLKPFKDKGEIVFTLHYFPIKDEFNLFVESEDKFFIEAFSTNSETSEDILEIL